MALSFSGLKTALWDHLQNQARRETREDLAASFQEAIVDVLVDRCTRAMTQLDVPRLAVAGGVSANSRLRARLTAEVTARGGEILFPPLALCTDNAAMIAAAAQRRLTAGLPLDDVRATSRLPLGARPASA